MAFPKGRLWRAHCVEISEERKIVKARKGLKPLVIRNKDAKNINNNAAFPKGRLWRAHCVNNSEGRKIVKARKGLKPLVISVNNSDNLSEKIKNLRFVINNFIHKEDIRMRISKKILTIILSIGLLFLVSCGDRPTGSDTGRTLSYYAGNWWGKDSPQEAEKHLITIENDGSAVYHSSKGGDITIIPEQIKRNSDTSYTANFNNMTANINFDSDTTGTAQIDNNPKTTITKR